MVDIGSLTGEIDMNDSRLQVVKSKVLIPRYFSEIIIPELKDYYSDYPADFDARPMVKCPLHVEDTPSFRWYEETNTFFCFGCRAGGDVIHLHRKFMFNIRGSEPSFPEALNFLYDYFIAGKEQVNINLQASLDRRGGEVESSSVEQVMLVNYIKKLEERLRHTNAPIERKADIYDLIDNVQVLVASRVVHPSEALDYIKEKVKLI
jgi:hypothetical protein